MAEPQLDIATYLASNIGALTLGTNCFAGPVVPVGGGIPDEAIFVIGTGGFQKIIYLGVSDGFERPTVQVWVRSDVEDLYGGLTLARNIISTIDAAVPSGYVAVRADSSEPIYLGKDDKYHHEWSINLTLIKS